MYKRQDFNWSLAVHPYDSGNPMDDRLVLSRSVDIFLLDLPCADKDDTVESRKYHRSAIASHPLGPFVKQPTPIASPETICGGTGRCDDVIMQARPDGVHLYHSVKGSNVPPGSGIRHRLSTDSGLWDWRMHLCARTCWLAFV